MDYDEGRGRLLIATCELSLGLYMMNQFIRKSHIEFELSKAMSLSSLQKLL